MDDDFLAQVQMNWKLESVILAMETVIDKAKLEGSTKDYSVQEDRLEVLREFKFHYLQAIEQNRILTKMNWKLNQMQVRQTDILKDLEKQLDVFKKAEKF